MAPNKSEEIGARIGAAESRLTALEVHHSHTAATLQTDETKLDDISKRLTTLEERVSHLPSKDFIVKSLITVLTLVGLFIAFQGKIRELTSEPEAGKAQTSPAR